jgi:hypothetical protein
MLPPHQTSARLDLIGREQIFVSEEERKLPAGYHLPGVEPDAEARAA